MKHELNLIQRERGDIVADGSETVREEPVCEACVLLSCAESWRDHREELVQYSHFPGKYTEIQRGEGWLRLIPPLAGV